MTMTFPSRTLAIATLSAAALAGCEVSPPEEKPGEEPEPAGFTQPGEEGGSIMRPDIEAAQQAEKPLEPLAVTLGFPDGGSELSEDAQVKLAEFIDSEQVKASGAIRVSGHSDSAGSDEANLRASKTRADAVAAALVEAGIDEDRITVVAFGEQNPIRPNALPDGSPNEKGRALNRRVVLRAEPPAEEGEAEKSEMPQEDS